MRTPSHWARKPVDPVLFWPALEHLLADGDRILVEAGPGRGLSSIARRHEAVRSGRSSVVTLLPAGRPGAQAERDGVRVARETLTGRLGHR